MKKSTTSPICIPEIGFSNWPISQAMSSLFLETASNCFIKAGLEFMILLPLWPECWDYWHVSLVYSSLLPDI